MKLIVKYKIGCHENTNLSYTLVWQEFVLEALSIVNCLKAISLNILAVIYHHMFVPSPLLALLHSIRVLMEPLDLLVT